MTMDADKEDGPEFWSWIVDHYHWNIIHGGTLLDTYLFGDTTAKEPVGTVSLIHDDRDVGKTFSIPGIWIGGANVKGSRRREGVAAIMFAQIDFLIAAVASSQGNAPLQANFFADVEYSERHAEKLGFRFREELHIKHFDKTARWWSKFYDAGENLAG